MDSWRRAVAERRGSPLQWLQFEGQLNTNAAPVSHLHFISLHLHLRYKYKTEANSSKEKMGLKKVKRFQATFTKYFLTKQKIQVI